MSAVRQLGFHRDWENYRDLVIVLLQKEIKVRYKNKILGYFWSIANPLAHAFVYFFAFKVLMRVRTEDYVLVLVSALFAWQWLANSVSSGTRLFVANSLIKKLNFPKIIIPLTSVLNHLIHFLLSIPVIVVFTLVYQKMPSFSWIVLIPVLLVIQFILTLGISLIFSSLNLFFRDLERLVGILLHFAFFLTPILYSEDMIPDAYQPFILFHPFAPLMISWRNLFIEGRVQPMYLLSAFISACLFFGLGYFIYSRLSWKFAEVA